MTFNTGNNVPSTDPRDLYDNAENLDKLVNGADPFYADRLGKLRESWAGMENSFNNAQEGRETAFTLSQADKESRFQAFLVSSGYVSKGDYAANVVLAERNEYVAVSAATTGTTAGLYRPGPGATLPLALTGTWATDSANLLLLGDDVLRQELAGSGGAAMIGGGGQVVSSISALRALAKSNPSKSAFVTGYYAPGDGGGGAYYLDSTDTVSGDDGGSVIVAGDGGRWKLAERSAVSVRQFGAKGDGVTDDTLAINRLIDWANGRTQGTTIYFPDGRYLIPAGLAPITNGLGEIWFVGQSSGGTEILTQSGNLFSWGDATSPLVVGGGARSLKIKYASAPAAGSNVFRFEYCSRLQFDDLLLENIGTLAWCGASAERFASALTFSNVRGSTHNGGGQALFRLRYGAGLFLSNVSEFVGGVGHPTHPESMTTAASMYLFDCTAGNWDTVQAVNCIFERWGDGLVIAVSTGKVYQNFYFSNCIFDYFKGKVVYIDTAGGGTCAGVRMENCWYVSWETAVIELIGTAGYNDGHRFTGDVPIAGKQAVSYNMPNAKSVKFALDIGQPNRLGGYNAMEFVTGSKGFVVEGCTGNNDGAAVGLPWRGAYGVSVQGNCDNFSIVGNKLTGSTAPYSLGSNTSGSKLRRVANNADANYAGASGVLALAGSGVAAVNSNPFDIEVAIFGGSVSGITKNAIGIPGMTSGTLRLGPGESITVTYSVAPSLTAIALN